MDVSWTFGPPTVSLTCPCRPGFVYKNASTLAIHKKTSKTHQNWVNINERKDALSRSKDFENEIERLRCRLEHKEQIEKQLLARISFLEKQIYL